MIQFNLLPDVKMAYLKATKRKHLVMTISTSVIAGSLTVLVLLFLFVNVAQKQHLNALSDDINQQVKSLQDTPNLDSILTVQNQLLALGGLHDQKPVASRLYSYLTKITPAEVSISKLDVDFATSTMKFTGSGNTLSDVNQFADTLKFTEFTVGDSDDKKKAFSNVVLSSFGRTDANANFAIDLTFDPQIFDGAEDIDLVVPSTITSRSETEKPIFEESSEEE